MAGDDYSILNKRIQELEKKIEQLRVSRRVLMRLVEKSEAEKWELVNRLRREKEQLKIRNRYYARAIWQKNKELILINNKSRNHVVP